MSLYNVNHFLWESTKSLKQRKNSSEGTSGQLKSVRNGGSPVKGSATDYIHQANSASRKHAYII